MEAVCLLEHTRCEDCRKAAGATLVIMRYADYKTKFAACVTVPSSYNPEAKTISVYVPDDLDKSGLASCDWRAEEILGTVQIVREQSVGKPWILNTLTSVQRMILDYLGSTPYGGPKDAARNTWYSICRDHPYSNDPVKETFMLISPTLSLEGVFCPLILIMGFWLLETLSLYTQSSLLVLHHLFP